MGIWPFIISFSSFLRLFFSTSVVLTLTPAISFFHIARSYNRFKECLQTVKMRDAVALALINSAMGILPVWEMYRFIQLNFPYFVQRSYDYKCILRKALHCSKYFNKVALPEAGRRAGAWKLTDNMEDLAVAFNEVLQIAKCERSCYTLSEITGH